MGAYANPHDIIVKYILVVARARALLRLMENAHRINGGKELWAQRN